MPTSLKDWKGLSQPSHFPCKGQVPSCKSAALPDQYGTTGGKAYASSPMQTFIPVTSQRVDDSLDQLVTQNGTEMASRQSLAFLRSLDHNSVSMSSSNALQASYYAQGNKVNAIGAQNENSLFSSSLPELFSWKLKLSSKSSHFDHSVGDVASGHDEGDTFASLEEIEAQTIGNLLPGNDDLLAGVTEGLDFSMQPNSDDGEEQDLFTSVGGMDLGESENSAKQMYFMSGSNGSVAREHPLGHITSRTLLVRNIDSSAEDSEFRTLFEQYGDICTLYTACKHHGYIMISYYDIRAARKAMVNLQNRLIMGRKLDIHYSFSKDKLSERDISQGMLIASNVDLAVSNDELYHIFGIYGDVKEIRSISNRNHQRFIEFYDGRDAEAAFHALAGSSIAGKQIKLEPTYPGGMKDILQSPYKLEQDKCRRLRQQSSPSNHSAPGFPGHSSLGMDSGTAMGMQSAMQIPFLQSAVHHGISSSVPNGLASLLRVESLGKQSGLDESCHLQAPVKFDVQESTKLHPHSLPNYQDGLINGIHRNSPTLGGTNFNPGVPETIDSRHLERAGSNGHSLEQSGFGSAGSGRPPLLGNHYMWRGNSYHSQPPSMMWPNSLSFANGVHTSYPSARLQGLPGGPAQLLNTMLPAHAENLHVGSAPAVNPSIWDRQQQSFAMAAPETSILHPGSLETMRISNNSLHSMDSVPHNIFPNVFGNCMDLPVPPSNVVGLQSPHDRCIMFPGRGPMLPSMGSLDHPSERARGRRNGDASNLADKKQYELDIGRIIRGEDARTTLMIKNIPNKYTSKMLLAAIDEHHRGTYDFIYLPIDFKNKCNVGYAFINMTDPSQIIPFYKAFNGKKWEKFNSEKVASLAYARIQGKAALIAHFQNSSLMNEDKRCRPILFNTEGPNAGDQVPFPMGVNVRSRPGKVRTSFYQENQQGSPPCSATRGGF